MFITYVRTRMHIPDFNGSLASFIKQEAKSGSRHAFVSNSKRMNPTHFRILRKSIISQNFKTVH
jgi:hypothetical protein